MIEAYGARLVLTPGAGTDIDLALSEMRRIVAEDPDAYFFPGEFENPDNPEAQEASGREIWEQLGGRVDAVVAAQGTGGWITGRHTRAQGERARRRRVRGRARRVPADQRAALGHPRRAGHRRRHHPAEPRPRRDGRDRHGQHRRGAGDGAADGARGGPALRSVLRDERGGRREGRREAPGAASLRHRRARHRAAVPQRRAVRRTRRSRRRSPTATTRPTPTSWPRWRRTATA